MADLKSLNLKPCLTRLDQRYRTIVYCTRSV